MAENNAQKRPLVTAGILLGLGLGGFFDGIVLHQILQWHHMVSTPYPPTSLETLQINTLWDGVFHATAWLFTLAGLFALWRASQRTAVQWSTQVLVGALLAGWGLFNLVEGVIDHHLLQLHHVRPGPNQLYWDLAFLLWGGIVLGIGWLLIRTE